LEDTEADGWFDQTYIPNTHNNNNANFVRNLHKLERKQSKNQKEKATLQSHFHPICGHYRFNETLMPKVSVIITTQNEVEGWMSISVHSILARTPPDLLEEIILVDDNGADPAVIRSNLSLAIEHEFVDLAKLPNVRVIRNEHREGCARSRLVGARQARGEILYFTDSHIEMISSTWYQHLILPILENPKTMSIQYMEVISDSGSKDYYINGDPGHGVLDKSFGFTWLQQGFTEWKTTSKHGGIMAETPSNRHYYETPVGPGALFAMRKDEFWRLGGYDEGLYVWGSENIELALKTWMCGGRIVFVPCSRSGHMFRVKPNQGKTSHWPPYLEPSLIRKAGADFHGQAEGWQRRSAFARIKERNNLRVLDIWVGNHPARDAYYRQQYGTPRDDLPPEWKQYIDELNTDPAALEQKRLKEANQCHDFEWFDKHVLMKLIGMHHPWHT